MKFTIDNGILQAAKKNTFPQTPLAFILETARPFAWWGVLTVILIAAAQIASATMPYFMGHFVDSVLATTSQTELTQAFLFWGGLFVLLNFVVLIFSRISGFTMISFLLRQNTFAMQRLYDQVTPHSHSYFSNRFAGSVGNKIFHAGDGSTRLLEIFMQGGLRQIIIICVMSVVLYTISPLLTFMYIVVVVAAVILNVWLVRIRRRMVVDYSLSSSKLRGETVDLMTNIQATRQYVREVAELNRLADATSERNWKDRVQWRMAEYIHVINHLISFALLLAVISTTYWLFTKEVATVGSLATAMLSMFRITGVLVDVGDIMNRVIRMYGEVEEGIDEVKIPHEIPDQAGALDLQLQEGQINWNNVSFTFGENKVFNNFNLDIKPGQRIGLVGPSGAGKTTFVSLLLRQHDIDNGAIMIDGQNIAEVTQDSLRSNIAVVPQEPLLFHRTIRENISYGKPDATKSEIRTVAAKAQALDFILDLPEKFDTLVGERGVKLSGGQKQRVAIARAMLKDAPILVLDEATSALDSESEVLIQKALHELMEGKTVIAIAHRLSTLREMDRILVLENGQIVEDGTHDELTKAGGTYARLWEHQAGGFLQE